MSSFGISQMNQIMSSNQQRVAAAAAAAAAAAEAAAGASTPLQLQQQQDASLIAQQLQQAASAHSPKGSNSANTSMKTNSRKPYTNEEVFGLIDLYAKYTSNGLTSKQRFNKLGHFKTLNSLIAEEMTAKFPESLKVFDKENIRKKLDEIKLEYMVFRYLLMRSGGIGWNVAEGRFNLNYQNIEYYKKDYIDSGGQMNHKTDTFKKLIKHGNFYIYHYHQLIGRNLQFDDFEKRPHSIQQTVSAQNVNIEPELMEQQQPKPIAQSQAQSQSANQSAKQQQQAAAQSQKQAQAQAQAQAQQQQQQQQQQAAAAAAAHTASPDTPTQSRQRLQAQQQAQLAALNRHNSPDLSSLLSQQNLDSASSTGTPVNNHSSQHPKGRKRSYQDAASEDDVLLEIVTKLSNDEPATFKFNKVCELVEKYRVVRKLLISSQYDYEYKKKCLRQF